MVDGPRQPQTMLLRSFPCFFQVIPEDHFKNYVFKHIYTGHIYFTCLQQCIL